MRVMTCEKNHPHSEILICADTPKSSIGALQKLVCVDDEKMTNFEYH
jgi:hypothetical protein